jgi:hypothetical protein
MADPTILEAPFGRGTLIGVRPWEVGRKVRGTWDLVGTKVVRVPSVVGFVLSKVTVRYYLGNLALRNGGISGRLSLTFGRAH